MISAEYLRSLLDYDPNTGVFRRRVARKGVSVGDEPGYEDHIGYRRISIDRKNYLAHRLAWLWMTGEWPELDIDHRDGCPANNRWSNLRQATKSQNLMNQQSRGVRLTPVGRWEAYIFSGPKYKYLGTFDDECAAIARRTTAERELFGEFTRKG